MKTPQEKYMNDPAYRRLVDMMHAMIAQAQFTPSEMREAAVLASIRYECSFPHPFTIPPELEKAFGVLQLFKDGGAPDATKP